MATSTPTTVDSPSRTIRTMSRVEYAAWVKKTKFRGGKVPTYRLTPTSTPAPAWSKMDRQERKWAKVLRNL